jgi:tetrahydromethanopterin S-methyltransferase subunit E
MKAAERIVDKLKAAGGMAMAIRADVSREAEPSIRNSPRAGECGRGAT